MPRRRSTFSLVLAGGFAFLFFVIFVALGTWQLQRRVWKLDLIARVEQRVHAPPVAPPAPNDWAKVTAASDEYRHVALTGVFLDGAQTLVQAVTDLGAGYWVLTPLRVADGSLVLVNRGFVAADARERIQPGGAATITGLLRISEPRGAFLRHNDPRANHWYSRDVPAIAQARGLTDVAPYFVDADATPPLWGATSARKALTTPVSDAAEPTARPPAVAALTAPVAAEPTMPGLASARPTLAANAPATEAPVGGLTVIRFHNSHLVYAITWYTLALMVAGAMWIGFRGEAHT